MTCAEKFHEIFQKVCSNVMKIRKEKGTKEPLQEMFQYKAETLSGRLEFSKPQSVNYSNSILWQVEQLKTMYIYLHYNEITVELEPL